MPDASLTSTTANRVPMQVGAPLTWMTLHRVRFDKPVDAKAGGVAGPVGAALALIGPDSRLDANGMRESFSGIGAASRFMRIVPQRKRRWMIR
jgi:hypothetical protein